MTQLPNKDFSTDREFASGLDSTDPLAEFRSRFFVPDNTIYFVGNSLGLMPRASIEALRRVTDGWAKRGIGSWLGGDRPWVDLAERLGARMAPFVGAGGDEVVAAGGTTVNLHALLSTFYHPERGRTKILADALNFPSDIYAARGQIRLKGGDPSTDLVLVPSADGRFLDESAIIDLMSPEIALVLLPTVLYRSGQLLDVGRLAAAARERGIVFGLDCSHSAGVVPHYLDEWDVDFAAWCAFKYINGGPGCTGFLYVNRRHFDRPPGLPGWIGVRKERLLDMMPDFEHDRSAGGWQISSPNILSMAPLQASLRILGDAGIAAVRGKSLRMTEYLMRLIDELLPEERYGFRIGTPREQTARGAHVALEHPDAARRVVDMLSARGVVVSLRPPHVIRLCPSPLYNTYDEIWQVVDHLRSFAASGELHS